MAAKPKTKSKKDTIKIWLVSTLGTGYFYTTKKPARGEKASIKIVKNKYDPVARKHAPFKEEKIYHKNKKN